LAILGFKSPYTSSVRP